MTRLAILLSMFLTLTMASFAQAGFHMEPHAGFGVSNKWKQNDEGDLSKTIFGIKLGYQAPMGLQVGGDIQIGAGTYKQKAGSLFGTDIKFADVAIGPYLGYQSAMGLRGYLSIFRSAQAWDDTSDNTITGIGYKLGVGYRIVEWFAVNAEYITTSYDEFDNSLASGDIDPKFKVDTIMLVVSFPFNFGGK